MDGTLIREIVQLILIMRLLRIERIQELLLLMDFIVMELLQVQIDH